VFQPNKHQSNQCILFDRERDERKMREEEEMRGRRDEERKR